MSILVQKTASASIFAAAGYVENGLKGIPLPLGGGDRAARIPGHYCDFACSLALNSR